MACGDGRCGRCDRLVDTLERVRAMPVPKDEETAKVKIILPVLAALGWDPAGDDVIFEFPVNQGGARRHGKRSVDIALAPEPESPVSLIEAKSPTQALRLDAHVLQVLQQAFFGSANICILTSGTVWWFYLPRAEGNPGDRRFAELHLDSESLEDQDKLEETAADLKAYLSRETLLDGSAEKRARQVLTARKNPDLLAEQLPGLWQELSGRSADKEPHPCLVRVITELVYEKTGLRPTPEQVAELLRSQPGAEPDDNDEPTTPSPSPAGRPKPPPESPPPPAAAQPPNPATEDASPPLSLVGDGELLVPSSTPKPGMQPIALILWDQRHRTTRAYDIPVRVAQLLLEHYPDDFLDVTHKLPKSVGSRRRAGMRRPKPVRKDARIVYYIAAGWQRSVLIKHARRFLSAFKALGHDPDELWLVYKADNTPLTEDSTSRPESKPRQTQGKPTGFELWGHQHAVEAYYDIASGVAEAIYRRRPADFWRVEKLAGSIISRDTEAFKRSERIATTDWYIDTSWKGKKHVTDARRLLRHFDYDPDDLEVLYGTEVHDYL